MAFGAIKKRFKDNKKFCSKIRDYCNFCYKTLEEIDYISFEEYGKIAYKEKCQVIIDRFNNIIIEQIQEYNDNFFENFDQETLWKAWLKIKKEGLVNAIYKRKKINRRLRGHCYKEFDYMGKCITHRWNFKIKKRNFIKLIGNIFSQDRQRKKLKNRLEMKIWSISMDIARNKDIFIEKVEQYIKRDGKFDIKKADKDVAIRISKIKPMISERVALYVLLQLMHID
jgi:hypothetical protein